ncbi:MAG: TraR/DksA family transcriptional regulator [Acidimicrobiia bacterium]|nr:TraR/DksA family transcriptional regulator [Acidimicrobiia bacterium]
MVARPTRFAPKTLDALVELLSTRRVALTRRAETLRSEASDALRDRDISDALDDDAPTEDIDVVTQLILIERAEERLWEVEAALDRVADGTYGYCVRCGADIPLLRLRALPAAPHCVECSRRPHRLSRSLAYRSHLGTSGVQDQSRSSTWLLAAGGEQ